jgi:hypothetical protein
VVADARHFGQVQAVADQAVEWYGRLDTWVHLAAVAVYAPGLRRTGCPPPSAAGRRRRSHSYLLGGGQASHALPQRLRRL